VPARQLHSTAARYAVDRRAPRSDGPQNRSSRRHFRRAAADTPQAGWSVLSQRRMARLEAILFLAREPLASRKLSQYANLADGTEARTLLRRLNEHLDRAQCAFRVEEVAGGFQLATRPKFASWLRRLPHVPRETRLSAPALETLAVVAYRQPVMRAEIEGIRGVNCGEILRQLLERDLIRVSGRGDELGRPYLYSTTRSFLLLFGLRSLDELPRAEIWRGTTAPIAATGGNSGSSAADGRTLESPCDRKVEEESEVTLTKQLDADPAVMIEPAPLAGAGLREPSATPHLRARRGAKKEEEEEEETFDEDEDNDEDDDDSFDDEDDDFDEEDAEDLDEESDEESEEESEEDEDEEWEEIDEEEDWDEEEEEEEEEEEGDEEEDEWDDEDWDDDEDDWDDEEEEEEEEEEGEV